jgi:hypothetical protein
MSSVKTQIAQQQLLNSRHELEQRKVIIVIMFLGLIVLMGFFGFYIYGNVVRSDCVHYSNCFKPLAPYSVQPNVEATSILNRCGKNGNGRCQARAENLEQAVQFCETYANICDIFSFDSSKNKVLIHPNNTGFSPLTKSSNNVYYRNVGVTFQNSGSGNITAENEPPAKVTNSTGTAFDLIPALPSINKSQKTALGT